MARRFPDLFPRETPKGFILRAAGVWTAVVSLFLVLGVRYSSQEELEISLNRARDAFRKDVAYRAWANERGGVYVPLDAKTPPNPYLEHIPDRDVATTTGKKLTLVNPAYMTRMVHELGAKEYGLKGHITSLNPIRPENAPDAWEKKALRSFDAGGREFWEKVSEDGRPFLRFMGAFLVQQGCLKCHGSQGYRVGDVRGGISVTVPMGTQDALLAHAHRNVTVLALVFLWTMGLGGIAIWARLERRLRMERSQALDELQESQQLYQSLAEDLPLGLFRRDTANRLTYANPTLLKEIGRSSEEILGRGYEALYTPDTVAELRAEDAQVMGGESLHKVHSLGIPGQPEGRVREVVKTPIRNASGEVVGVQGVSWDVTERRQAQENLAASAAYYRSIFEDSAIPIWEEDFSAVKRRFDELAAQGVEDSSSYFDAHPGEVEGCARMVRITAVNAESLRFFGAGSKEELTGSPSDFFADGSLKVFGHELAALASGATRFETPLTLRRVKGETRQLLLRLAVLSDATEDLARVLVSFIDVTDLKRAEEESRRLTSEVEHMMRLEGLGRLAGGVAHDMNNVLSAIMALASVLEMDENSGPAARKTSAKIVHAAERGRDLVKGLTGFARKEMQEAVPLDLNELVRKEAGLLQRTTLQRVNLQLDLCETEPWVKGEQSALATALMNLCVNALDAMPRGGTLRITTRCLGQDRAELAVSDTGDGMPPEVLDRAMEPFFTTKAAGKGTGLGLAMVYGTMKAHGGTVELSSVPGEGTRVALVFPTLSQPLLPEPAVGAGAEARHSPRRILLVDDDELIQASVPLLLEDLGHHVEVASGGLQALRLLETGLQVDLVILDLNMPGMSGRDTLARLRMLRPELPVVIASGFVGEAGEEAVPFGTGVKVLKKPFSLGELRDAMDSFPRR